MFGNLWTFFFCDTHTPSTFVLSLSSFNGIMTPLFCVWVLSLFVWFGLDLAVLNAHFFNVKHTYVSLVNRATISLVQISTLYKNSKKQILLSQFFAKNLDY